MSEKNTLPGAKKISIAIQRSLKPWFTKSTCLYIFCLIVVVNLYPADLTYGVWQKICIHVFFVLVSSRVFVCCSACSYIQQISGVLHKVFMEKQNPGHHQYLKTMAKTTLYWYLYLHIGGYFCLVSIVDLQSNCF